MASDPPPPIANLNDVVEYVRDVYERLFVNDGILQQFTPDQLSEEGKRVVKTFALYQDYMYKQYGQAPSVPPELLNEAKTMTKLDWDDTDRDGNTDDFLELYFLLKYIDEINDNQDTDESTKDIQRQNLIHDAWMLARTINMKKCRNDYGNLWKWEWTDFTEPKAEGKETVTIRYDKRHSERILTLQARRLPQLCKYEDLPPQEQKKDEVPLIAFSLVKNMQGLKDIKDIIMGKRPVGAIAGGRGGKKHASVQARRQHVASDGAASNKWRASAATTKAVDGIERKVWVRRGADGRQERAVKRVRQVRRRDGRVDYVAEFVLVKK